METWNYLTFGALERLVIIAAAMVIGYWGYRIFPRSQRSGLSLIVAATVVLLGALLTAERHLQSVNASLIAAASPPPSPPSLTSRTAPTSPAPVTASAAAPDSAPRLPHPAPLVPQAVADNPAPAEPAGPAIRTTDAAPLQAPPEQPEDDERVPRLMPLASGQELGGRITSIRSENVTLEWSPEVQRRRVISASPGARRAP